MTIAPADANLPSFLPCETQPAAENRTYISHRPGIVYDRCEINNNTTYHTTIYSLQPTVYSTTPFSSEA